MLFSYCSFYCFSKSITWERGFKSSFWCRCKMISLLELQVLSSLDELSQFPLNFMKKNCSNKHNTGTSTLEPGRKRATTTNAHFIILLMTEMELHPNYFDTHPTTSSNQRITVQTNYYIQCTVKGVIKKLTFDFLRRALLLLTFQKSHPLRPWITLPIVEYTNVSLKSIPVGTGQGEWRVEYEGWCLHLKKYQETHSFRIKYCCTIHVTHKLINTPVSPEN